MAVPGQRNTCNKRRVTLPDIKVNKVPVEPVAVVVQKVVPLHAEDHDGRFEPVQQRIHPFYTSLVESTSFDQQTSSLK